MILKYRAWKFRAWNKIDKEMNEVTGLRFEGIGGGVRTVSYKEKSYPIEEIELVQFTGLIDKNGKEIFEGDILAKKEFENIEVVIPTIYRIIIFKIDEFKVIGNKFENANLLK